MNDSVSKIFKGSLLRESHADFMKKYFPNIDFMQIYACPNSETHFAYTLTLRRDF